eukprot:TRINITY_DN2899_c0_g2_i1.p1 TRINITY_DN2899_c0_g2~~TRINITY_DN2899_c0_g2_i1.p1  ORF type:complete len:101 (-),score=1.62 TRINITY_DN2899_c0_g2_i1:37-339(-)
MYCSLNVNHCRRCCGNIFCNFATVGALFRTCTVGYIFTPSPAFILSSLRFFQNIAEITRTEITMIANIIKNTKTTTTGMMIAIASSPSPPLFPSSQASPE